MYKKAQISLKLAPGARPRVEVGQKVTAGDILVETTSSELDEFNLATLLSVSPQKISRFLTVKPHQQVEAGDVIARKKGLISQQVIKAPLSGEFILMDEAKGIAGIKHKQKSQSVTAWFSGTVEEMKEGQLVLSTSGKMISAKSGKGPPASGKLMILDHDITALTMPTDVENCILVVKNAGSDTIAKADTLGAVAIVAETLDLPPFTLPYLLLSDVAEIHSHNGEPAILYGDEKQLLIIAEHGNTGKHKHN